MGDILQGLAAMTQPKNPVAWGDLLAGPGGFAGGMDESGALGGYRDPGPVPAAPPGFDGAGYGDPSAIPGGDAGQAEALSVLGFKPKKRSFLGLLGDAFLLHSGHKGPFFADRIEKKNMQRAFEGFSRDPMETVRRVATFNPEAAWKMYGQLRDDERLDLDKQSIRNARQEKIITQANRLLGSVIINEDGTSPNYDMVKSMYEDVMKRNGIDAVLPDVPDADFLTALVRGDMTANQDAMMQFRKGREERQAKEGERRLDQKDRSLDQRDRQLDQDEVEESGRNNRSAEAIRARKTGKSDGNGVTHKVNPGENVQVRRKGGQIVAARVMRNGQWLRLSPEAFELFKSAMEK